MDRTTPVELDQNPKQGFFTRQGLDDRGALGAPDTEDRVRPVPKVPLAQ